MAAAAAAAAILTRPVQMQVLERISNFVKPDSDSDEEAPVASNEEEVEWVTVRSIKSAAVVTGSCSLPRLASGAANRLCLPSKFAGLLYRRFAAQGEVHGYKYKVRKEDVEAEERMNHFELLQDICIRQERIAMKLARNRKVRATPAAYDGAGCGPAVALPRASVQCTSMKVMSDDSMHYSGCSSEDLACCCRQRQH